MINESKMRCRQVQGARRNWFNIATYTFVVSTFIEVFVMAREEMYHDSYGLVQHCNRDLSENQCKGCCDKYKIRVLR